MAILEFYKMVDAAANTAAAKKIVCSAKKKIIMLPKEHEVPLRAPPDA